MGAAFHRAAHQVLEHGRLFPDPLALPILGPDGEAAVRAAGRDPSRTRLRLFIALRSRFAEEAMVRASGQGVRQFVVLGAGLDTFAYRNPLGGGARVFEADHPATQAWKRRRLKEAGIAVPPDLAYVPVDFERDELAAALARAGFDPGRPACFSWLGVVPYLTAPAVFATLAFIASLPGGAAVVFDYGNPPSPAPGQVGDAAARAELARRVAAIGETFRSHFETPELHARLAALGYRIVEDLGPALIRERFFPGRAAAAHDRGGHIVLAAAGPFPTSGR